MSSKKLSTRSLILEKTWQLLERTRGQGVRVDDIARAVGISRQAVYLHFGSRAGLLIAAVRYIDEVKGAAERVQAVSSAASGPEMLDALIDFWGNYIPEIYGPAKALLAVRDTDRAAAAAWDDRMSALQQGCRSVVRCIARDRLLPREWTVERATDVLWSMLSIEVWEHLTHESGWSNPQYISLMKTALRRMLIT